MKFNDKPTRKCLWCEAETRNFNFCSKLCQRKFNKVSGASYKTLHPDEKRVDANGDRI